MNWKLLTGVILTLASSTACAADGRKARQMFREMDRNGDRALQFEEVQAARAALFDRLDANRNGQLDKGEAQAAVQEDGRFRIADAEDLDLHARRMDLNSDGRISRAEFFQFIPDRLIRADTDDDRSLSFSELKALRQR